MKGLLILLVVFFSSSALADSDICKDKAKAVASQLSQLSYGEDMHISVNKNVDVKSLGSGSTEYIVQVFLSFTGDEDTWFSHLFVINAQKQFTGSGSYSFAHSCVVTDISVL